MMPDITVTRRGSLVLFLALSWCVGQAQLPAQILWYHTNTPGSPLWQRANGLHDGKTLYQKSCVYSDVAPPMSSSPWGNSGVTNWRIDDLGVFSNPSPGTNPGYIGTCTASLNSFTRNNNTYAGTLTGCGVLSGVGMVKYGLGQGEIDVNIATLGYETHPVDLVLEYPTVHATGRQGNLCGYDAAAIFCTSRNGNSAFWVWTSCLPPPSHIDQGLAIHDNDLLACQIPRIHILDRIDGSLDSTFYTHPDSVVLNSKSEVLLDGDTLYWTAIRDTTLHVGKYRLDSGTMMWEQELIGFDEEPMDLLMDPFGRLWTASNNELIWVDALTGTYDHASVNGEVESFDVFDDHLYVSGVSSGSSFVFKAILQP